MIKKAFGEQVIVNILVKDYETQVEDLYLNKNEHDLDQIADSRYSEEDLNRILV